MEVPINDVRGRAQVARLAAIEQLRGKEQLDALSAAFAAAKEQIESNRVVSAASRPVMALAKVAPEKTAQWVRELVAIAETEPHNLRRSHALQRLAFVTSPYPEILALIVPALAEALLGGRGPRIDRVIRNTFELIASVQLGSRR